MFKKIPALSVSFCIFASAIFSGCSSETKTGTANEATIDTSGVEEIKEDLSNFNYVLPSPLQIASVFNRAGLKFSEKNTNPLSNKSKYNSEFSKTVNIGVYGADLAYALLSNQNQYALNSLKTIKDLSDEIGIGSIYQNGNYLTKFKDNINNIDSLSDIISGLQLDSKAYLIENEKKVSSLLIFGGGYIESIYIATQSIQKSNMEKLSGKMAEQLTTLNSIISLLDAEKKTENIKDFLAGLKKVQTAYKSCADYKAKLSALEEQEEPTEFSISETELKNISSEIAKVRNEITAN